MDITHDSLNSYKLFLEYVVCMFNGIVYISIKYFLISLGSIVLQLWIHCVFKQQIDFALYI